MTTINVPDPTPTFTDPTTPQTPAPPATGGTITVPGANVTPQFNTPAPWHMVVITAFVVGIGIWLVEQNVDSKTAMILAAILLLGIMYAQNQQTNGGFTRQLNSVFGNGANANRD